MLTGIVHPQVLKDRPGGTHRATADGFKDNDAEQTYSNGLQPVRWFDPPAWHPHCKTKPTVFWPDVSMEKAVPLPEDMDTVEPDFLQHIDQAMYCQENTAGCEFVQAGAKLRPLRDGGGPSSMGRFRPELRWRSPMTELGTKWKSLSRTKHLGAVLKKAMAGSLPPGTKLAAEENPFSETQMKEAIKAMDILAGHPSMDIQAGQPFR